MKQKATVQGRSMLFNVLFVLLNLTGLTMIVIGSHANFEAYFLTLNFIGYLLIALSAAGIFIFQGRLMMANVSRILVGSLFIVSGLVKANDPIGFSYKLQEYFEDGALAYRIKELFGAPGFSLEFLIDYALFLSVVICIAEIVLGVLTIIGGKIKLVSYLMLLMMLFFTFLTWHTANCDSSKKFIDRDTYAINDPLAKIKLDESKTNKEIKIISKTAEEVIVQEFKQPQCVDDCGCFGDAMKGSVGRSLTPKESLWKDIILVYLVLWIFVAQWIIEPNTKSQNVRFTLISTILIFGFSWVFGWYFPVFFGLVAIVGSLWILKRGGFFLSNYWGSALFSTIISVLMTIFVLMYEPLKDYRPYSEGTDLIVKMNDGIIGKYENVFILKNSKTGKEETYTEKEYTDTIKKMWENPNLKFVRMSQEVVIPSRIPSITEQFNPFLALSDISPIEMRMPIVKDLLKAGKIEALKILDIAYNSTMEVPMNEYSEQDYPIEGYRILDTIMMDNPEFTEISLRDYIVKTDQILVLTSKTLLEGNWKNIERYKAIYKYCKSKEIPFVIITNANREQINYFRKKYSFQVPIFLNDETELKAIARSNPSLMVIQKGKVKGKYPHRSTPSVDWLKNNVLKK